jgi:hypothetical protein
VRYNDFKIVEAKRKQKDADQVRGSESMPAKKKRGEHPFQGRLVGESIQLDEAARIQHAEDLIFWEGSKGVVRALESLKKLEQGGHKDVTIKWDGSPAIIFGRDSDGSFVLTDKSGFTAKGYDGRSKSADDLENMLLNRSGGKNRENPSYQAFAANMKDIFDEYEKATPKDFRGFFKGDLLYFNTPEQRDGKFVFKPNIVEYAVDPNSEIGQKIARSKTAIVIHRMVEPDGSEHPLKDYDIFEGDEVLVVPPVTAQRAPAVNDTHLIELRQLINKNARAIDDLLNPEVIRANKMSDLPQIFYTYLNSKVDTGLDNLARDFPRWLQGSKVSNAKKQKVSEWIGEHNVGFNALWETVAGIMRVKDDIIKQLDQHDTDITASINGQAGGEGYVLAHPEGDIKLVPREFFSRANRAVER